MSSGIVRVKREPATFFVARKAPFVDDRLSFAARGLLAYLFTKPDNWEARNHDLIKASPGGKAALQTILKELRKYGYMSRRARHKDDGGFDGWDTIIYENPADNPDHTTDIPISGKTGNWKDGKLERRETGKSTSNNDSTKNKKEGAKIPPPPKTSKPKRYSKQRPAGVIAYQHVAHLYPDKALWTDLDDTIGDKPESLKRWQSVVRAYIGCGWNKRNINAMLDFYRRGEIPGTRGSNDNKPTTVPPKDYGQFADKAELLAAVEAAKERERQEYEKLQKRT